MKKLLKSLFLYSNKIANHKFKIALIALLVVGASVIYIRLNSNQETDLIEQRKVDVQVFEAKKDYVSVKAKIISNSKIDIYAQTAGIVSNINVSEGSAINAGATILNLANNYTSGNAAATQAQIAKIQFDQAANSLEKQIEAIGLQRELAELQDDASDEQKKIAEAALNDTANSIEKSQDNLEDTKNSLEELASSDPQNSLIPELEQSISQQEAALTQLRASQRNLEFQAGDDSPPNEISDRSLELTKLQLGIQESAVRNQVETARLAWQAASIQASLFAPQSPTSGIVEAIYVSANQSVTPGQKLATIKSNNSNALAEAYIPSLLSDYINMRENSKIELDNDLYTAEIEYVSSIPVLGRLNRITFILSREASNATVGQNYLTINVPFNIDSSRFVPIDALHQTKNENIVYVAKDGLAVAKPVVPGRIVANYVEIIEGLTNNDIVITSRNVVNQDLIVIEE